MDRKAVIFALALSSLSLSATTIQAEPLNISQGSCYTCLNGIFDRSLHSVAQHSVFVQQNLHIFLEESSPELAARYKQEYCRCSNSGWITKSNEKKTTSDSDIYLTSTP